jgi:hypothetical protein
MKRHQDDNENGDSENPDTSKKDNQMLRVVDSHVREYGSRRGCGRSCGRYTQRTSALPAE